MKPKQKEEDIFGFRDFDEEVLRNLDYEQLKEELEEVSKTIVLQKDDIEKVSKILFAYRDKILNQESAIKKHIDLFYETLENLAKDREEFKFLQKKTKFLFWGFQSLGVLLLISFVLRFFNF